MRLTVAEYGQVGLTGVVSGPFGDDAQGRLAFFSNQTDGYVSNLIGPDFRSD